MKIGLQIYGVEWPGAPSSIGATLSALAQLVDDGGFASLWVMDHVFQVGQGFGHPHSAVMEGYTTLSWLAARTRRVRLGLLVGCPSYRPPGLLVKTVTTLDVLSGGRAYLGLGAGWYEYEARALGLPFPPRIGDRTRLLRQTLETALQMWSGRKESRPGGLDEFPGPICAPMPLTKPHPPIVLGFDGEATMPRLAACYADGINLHLGTPLEGFAPYLRDRYRNRRSELQRKLEITKAACETRGRDFSEMECTVLGTIRVGIGGMQSSEIVDLCGELGELGIGQAIFNVAGGDELAQVDAVATHVIPKVARFRSGVAVQTGLEE